MAVFGVSATGGGLALAGGAGGLDDALARGAGGLDDALARALAALPPAAPLVILIHGYRWDPRADASDPHRSLFAAAPAPGCPKTTSWPAGLGLAGPRAGLAIGFAWPATERLLPALLAGAGSGFARVYERAEAAGAALADLIGRIQRRAPWRRVDVMAHSLGARVALAALPRLERAPSRMLLLGAAEFASRAEALLAEGPAARPAVYNVTARANDLYDAAFEAFAPAPRRDDRALGRGLPGAPPGWIDLQLDSPGLRAFVRGRGIPLAGPAARACHWSFYTLPGAFALYRAILGRAPGWDVASLRAETALAAREPRWSRLVPRRPRIPDEAPADPPAGLPADPGPAPAELLRALGRAAG